MLRLPSRSGASRHVSLLVFATAAAVALTACGSGNTNRQGSGRSVAGDSGARSGKQEVLTEAAAGRILDDYEKANNKANATRDVKLLGSVEAGQLNVQSRAEYEQYETWSEEEKKEYGEEFSYVDRHFYLPDPKRASWFAVEAKYEGDDSTETLMVFDRVNGKYKMMAAVDFEGDIPQAVVDKNGHVEAVAGSERVGTLAPNELAPALNDFLETGGKGAGKDLATTDVTKNYLTFHREREADGTTTTYRTGEPAGWWKAYSLRLADGGVLTLFQNSYVTEYRMTAESETVFHPDGARAVYDDTARALVVDEYQNQVLATLTPSDKPKILATYDVLVDSR